MSTIESIPLVPTVEIGLEVTAGFNCAFINDRDTYLPAPSDSAVAPESGICKLVGRSIPDVERELILATLVHCRGNRTRAAGLLHISIRTMRNKLNEYASEGYVPWARKS